MITKEDFKTHYLAALRHIIKGEEDDANYAISGLKHNMADMPQDDVIGLNLRKIFKDLDHYGIDNLSGDYKSNRRSPWIKDEALLAMVRQHVEYLGNEQDLDDLQDFERRTALFFGRPLHAPKVVNG